MREIKRNVQNTWNRLILNWSGDSAGWYSWRNWKHTNPDFLIPYTSAYYQESDIGSDRTFKAGLDIKYGLDSFTLDAILVPDFGQNLTMPF
jgi:hypothetical protein